MEASGGHSVLLIGTGRGAFHLGHALRRAGVALKGVVGRERSRTDKLAAELGCPSFLLGSTLPDSSLRLVCVSDDAIAEVARAIPESASVVAHTSGAKGMDLLGGHPHRGVLWPIQSLSPGAPIDLSNVPLVIDANEVSSLMTMGSIARAVSHRVVELGQAQREALHLSAVLASNFPVFLLREAGRLLKQEGIDPALILPLWTTTTLRAAEIGADQALTGPARRGDLGTIRHQIDRLQADGDLRRAYALLSSIILKAYGHPTDGIEDV